MDKSFRLTKNFEFKKVYEARRRWSSPFFTMYVKKNQLDKTRLGVSISKKVGKSVLRNKIKRRIKEIFRNNMEKIKKGYDVVISVKPEAANADFKSMENQLKLLLKRGHIWHAKKNDNSHDKFV